MLEYYVFLFLCPQFVPKAMLEISLFFVKMGENGKIGDIDADLEMVEGWHDEITFLVAAYQKKFLLVVDFDGFVLISHIYGGFGEMDDSIHDERLFGYEIDIIWFYFSGMLSVNPHKSTIFTTHIFDNILLIDTEMFATDDFSIQIFCNRFIITTLLISFFLATKNNCFLS